ncbi:MAG: 60S ribosomal export protein NMD3 [Methanoregulaceae archaeon]|jgi:nonsense-mediated mRNA decay protein 3|nr:60S ribosomal export protein NMD3 [Methanoregulaceae archaeon]
MPRSSGSEKKIRENICPRCGAASASGELCGSCRIQESPWFSCEKRVSCTFCPTCGSRKEGGIWTDSTAEREEIARELVRRSVRFIPGVVSPLLKITIKDMTVNRSLAEVMLEGILFAEPVHALCQVEILWQKEQCDRCNRISGSYYEGIVQVRASERRPYRHELGIVERIAREIEEGCYASGERLSFISDIEETRDGLDITVGSQHIGQEIATAIVQRLGGRFTTHPKLVGERAGKRLYRITYSVRLPHFGRGDVVVVNGRPGVVIHASGKEIRYREIPTGIDRSAREDRVERYIGSIQDAREYLITFKEGNTIGVLDPETGTPRECAIPRDTSVKPGQTVRILKDGKDLLVVGEQ